MEERAIMLGDVVLDAVVQEIPSQYAEITDKPVEKGSDISDHMKVTPAIVELSGTMVEDAPSKLQALRNYQKEAKRLKYVGRNIFWNMVIENLETDHSVDNIEGYHYEITLREVRIAKPKTFQDTVKNPATDKQDKKTAVKVKEKTDIGRQQPQEKEAYTDNVKIKAPEGVSEKKHEYKRLITPPGTWEKNIS